MTMKNIIYTEQKKTVCEINKCAGCMACVELCPLGAVEIQDLLNSYNAVIDRDKCKKCNACYKICPNNNDYFPTQPILWYQGWAEDKNIRAASSSGGLAAAISYAFVENNGIVCSCVFSEGEFKFQFAETKEDVKKFAGSKYVKSNPYGIYKEMKEKLKLGKSILFIGLPCQAQAVRLYMGDLLQNNLYTIDLICHGTPSPKLLQDFLSQYHKKLDNIKTISFRSKNIFCLKSDECSIVQQGSVDKYSLAFLCSLDYTENCYSCQYAGIRRGSDLTIGDSWGSELLVEEQKKGISLILCQTDKGKKLLDISKLALFDVDLEKAVAANAQLRETSRKTEKSEKFFKIYGQKNFNRTTFSCLPQKCFRQFIKVILLKCRILRGWVTDYTIIISEKKKKKLFH